MNEKNSAENSRENLPKNEVSRKNGDEIAVRATHVKKDFYLPHEKSSKSLKSLIVNFFKKKDRGADTQHALRDISFEIKKGEFFGIVGRNGSGKSTLLKILAEIYQPTGGKVEHFGKLVPFIELGVGFNPELSGRENVYLNGALLGFSREEIAARYDDIVKFAELEDFMDQKLKNYSSGMQVRLAFSVATRASADILLVDEVLAVGDADFQRKCYDYFKGLKKSGTTVVFVTHDMGAVNTYCDRAMLIDKGVITSEGKPKDVADEYLKLFVDKSALAIKEPNRWGSGEIVFKNLKHDENGGVIKIDFNIVNQTEKTFHNVNFMTDIYSQYGIRIVSFGSETVAKKLRDFSLAPHETKHVSLEIDNLFNSPTFVPEFILKLENGAISDKIKQPFHINEARGERNEFNKTTRFKLIIGDEEFDNYPKKV